MCADVPLRIYSLTAAVDMKVCLYKDISAPAFGTVVIVLSRPASGVYECVSSSQLFFIKNQLTDV